MPVRSTYEDGVHEVAQVMGGAADAGSGVPPGLKGGADEFPSRVGQVAEVAAPGLHTAGVRDRGRRRESVRVTGGRKHRGKPGHC